MKSCEKSGSGESGRSGSGCADAPAVAGHVLRAHATGKGEHQLSEYVARLGLDECTEILAASPEGLPYLAARRDECRVGQEEQRSFEDVSRTWTLCVLSGLEAG